MKPDTGPWKVSISASGHGADVASDNFEHDVSLYLTGDFADDDQLIAYANDIARRLSVPPEGRDMVSVPRNVLQAISDELHRLELNGGSLTERGDFCWQEMTAALQRAPQHEPRKEPIEKWSGSYRTRWMTREELEKEYPSSAADDIRKEKP